MRRFALRIVYSDRYFADLGQHVFPIEKYIRLKDKLLADELVSSHTMQRI